eukprot:scaffold281943_cov31-Tisochrysis_lutea.AAC.2
MAMVVNSVVWLIAAQPIPTLALCAPAQPLVPLHIRGARFAAALPVGEGGALAKPSWPNTQLSVAKSSTKDRGRKRLKV